ncbi:Hsp20/alpha crystallin family protein [Oerskovia sp. M15]
MSEGGSSCTRQRFHHHRRSHHDEHPDHRPHVRPRPSRPAHRASRSGCPGHRRRLPGRRRPGRPLRPAGRRPGAGRHGRGRGRKLVVRGERKDERSEETEGRRVREVRYGAFHRVVTLPKVADADAVSARYDAGVLTVTVAGVFAGSTPQRIEVATSAA